MLMCQFLLRVEIVGLSFSYAIIPVGNSLPGTIVMQTNSNLFTVYVEITSAYFEMVVEKENLEH